MPRRIAGSLLVAAALVLPFEAPLFRLGPLQITTVELVVYALLATWGLDTAWKALRRPRPIRAIWAALSEDQMVRATVVWTLVIFVSAFMAPSYRTSAIKFALRALSGVLLFFAARELVSSPNEARRVLLAVITGALLSAATTIVEWLAPATALLWGPFRAGRFETLGLPRYSGAFAYPTIGAMYWEAAVPLVVAAPELWKSTASRRRSIGIAFAALLATVLLVGAILASATRSSLAGAAVGCLVLLGVGWRSGTWIPRVAAAGLVALALSSAFVLAGTHSGSLLAQRLLWWHDKDWFHVEYKVETSAAARILPVNEDFAVPVTLRNTGTVTWRRGGERPTRIAYHWVRAQGAPTVADFEGRRTDLPSDVAPGGVVRVLALVKAPADQGAYHLRLDLVEEGVTWFSERGNTMPEQAFDVRSPIAEAPILAPSQSPLPQSAPEPPSRAALWWAALTLWRQRPLLGIGPDNFRRRYQATLPPTPTSQPHADTRIHANSLYFETLADLGLAGMLALALLAFALWREMRAHAAAGRYANLGCGVAAGLFFVHGWLDYFFEFTPLFGLFWITAGLSTTKVDLVLPSRPFSMPKSSTR